MLSMHSTSEENLSLKILLQTIKYPASYMHDYKHLISIIKLSSLMPT